MSSCTWPPAEDAWAPIEDVALANGIAYSESWMDSAEPSLAIEGLSRPDWERTAFSLVRDATDFLNTQELLGLPERTEREGRERILLAQAQFGASTTGLCNYELDAEERKRGKLLSPGPSAPVARPAPPGMSIDDLPDDLITSCLAALSALPLARAGQASKRWRGLADHDALWLPILAARWPELLQLQHSTSLKALYRGKMLLQRPSPRISDFQFVVVLRSESLGVLLSKVFVGAQLRRGPHLIDEMSWELNCDDFLLTPDFMRWNYGSIAEGVSVANLIEENNFELTVTLFRDGKLAEVIPSVPHGITWDHHSREDSIEEGTLRFDGVGASIGPGHTIVFGAELIEHELPTPSPHWQTAADPGHIGSWGGPIVPPTCGRWVGSDEDLESWRSTIPGRASSGHL